MNKTEEAELINSVEAGEWSSVPDLSELKNRLVQAASETALKDYREKRYGFRVTRYSTENGGTV